MPATPVTPRRVPVGPVSVPPSVKDIKDSSGPVVFPSLMGGSRPNTVILKSESRQQLLNGLQVVRTIDLNALTANPKVTVGTTQFDFTPVLKNTKSLPNIAKRLQAIPQLVEVHRPPEMTASQIKTGLVVSSVLAYSFKPGACSNAANRAQIAATGISCFVYKGKAQQEAAFSTPGATEYVEDAAERAKALANARTRADSITADMQKDVQDFRNLLKDPAQRAQVEKDIGAAEAGRLESLDDATLTGELVNTSDNEIEDVVFMPWLSNKMPKLPNVDLAAAHKAIVDKMAEEQLSGGKEAAEFPVEQNFLTGFTLGDNYEWRQRISTTIKWCVVGCKKNYFVEVWAGFNYGFGLRFPMKFSGNYVYNPANGGTAQLQNARINMLDGDTDYYRSTGLPDRYIYGGQEFVAEIGATAGVAAKLPLIGGIGPFQLSPEFDLTKYLPPEYGGGNFMPPVPGVPMPSVSLPIEQIDLLNNMANLGVVAAKIHPAVFIGLTSDDMGLTVRSSQGQHKLTGTAQTIPLPMTGPVSNFKLDNPSYNVGLTLAPGFEARLSINLAVWGTTLKWPVEFASAKVVIPEGGKDFACHAGTKCSREYYMTPQGESSAFRGQLFAWAKAFDPLYLPECLDDSCTTSVKLVRVETVESALAGEFDNPGITMASIDNDLKAAMQKAAKYVNQSKARKANKLSNAMAVLAEAIYSKQCKDTICIDKVASLAAQMGPRAKEISTASPGLDVSTINKQVNKEFGPKFVAEVDASKARVEAQKLADNAKRAKAMGKQLDQGGGKLPKPRRN